METTLEKVANLAMRLGARHLADYGAVRSRHDFTQRQLMSCLILRAYLKATYRGAMEIIGASGVLRRALGLEHKLPHFTTLQKFSGRSDVAAIAREMVATIGRAVVEAQPRSPGGARKREAAAMDSTGLSAGVASEYFRSRSGKKCRLWVKLSVMVWCGSLMPMALALDLGPSNDRRQAATLLEQGRSVGRPRKLYADAGYDAEWIHRECREKWGVESLINPFRQRADGSRGGEWRAKMSREHLKRRGYGKRWAVETFFSGLKRKVGGAIAARRPVQMIAEAAFKVLAYTLFR